MYIDYLSKSRTNGTNTGREYLTVEELAAIAGWECENSRLEKVRDIFLFSCYTGLAYQDIKNLQQYNAITAKDGTRWLSIRRQMHSNMRQFPLLETACRIIDKYKDSGTENLLPVPSIQKVNAYLKEIASQCKLDRNLSFQSARSTFAVTIGIANKVSPVTISKLFGFRDYTTRCSSVSDKQISKEILDLSKKLASNKSPQQYK